MKRIISIILIIMILVSGLFILTGCGNNENKRESENAKKIDGVEVSYTYGKAKWSVIVPKKEDGMPKYEFTKEKPSNLKWGSTFYLETDNAIFTFGSSGLVYNTSKDYKAKYGETTATFDGYLNFIDDESINSRPKLAGDERLEINGRKAIRYYSREGNSGNYKYYGYYYKIAYDDISQGSGADVGVFYKTNEVLKEAKELDEETQNIINSLKITKVE